MTKMCEYYGRKYEGNIGNVGGEFQSKPIRTQKVLRDTRAINL